MKKTVFKSVKLIFALLGLALIVGAIFLLNPFVAVGGVMLGQVGTIIAGQASTVENVEIAEPGLHLDDIDSVVTKMWPAYAPLDQLLRTGLKDTRRATNSLKVRHYAVETKPFDDVCTGAIVAANQQSFDMSVGNVSLYGVGDTIFVNGVPGYAEGLGTTPLANSELELYVYQVDTANNLVKVVPVNGDGATTPNKSLLKTGVQDIALNNPLTIGGRALGEKAVQTDPSQYVPTDDYNYCQYFGSQIEISKWEQRHKKEVNFDTADQLELALYDYRVRREITYWRGARSVQYPAGVKTYFAGGISYFVPNQVDWTALVNAGVPTIKAQHIDEMVRQVFSGNAGSGQRWMFIGEYLWNALKRTEDIQKNLASNKIEYQFGLYFNKINTGDGELILIKHPLFKMMGWGYDAVILDANNIGERHFNAQKIESIDKAKLAQSNTDAKFISEVSCPVIKYPDTHYFIKGPVYTSLI